MASDNEKRNSVNINVELSGRYEDIADIMGFNSDKSGKYGYISDDFEEIVETIDRLGGGTRSGIAEELSSSTTVNIDGESIIDFLRVLEHYGLVELDQNTWRVRSTEREE